MSSINLTWSADGQIDSYSIYRSEYFIDAANLPTAFAAGITSKSYSDATVIQGKTYCYRAESVKNSVKKISQNVAIDTVLTANELLIFADAASYPSSSFVDSSVKASAVTAVGGIQMINTQPKLYDEGWVYFNNTGDYATSNKYLTANLQSALNTSEFTFECFVKPDYAKSAPTSRIFAVGTHSTDGMLSISKAGNPWVLSIDAYNGGWSLGTVVATPPPIPNGEIRHICLMRKAGIFYAFVDGVLSVTKSDITTFSLNQTNVFIGTHLFDSDTSFDSFGGYMSSIRLTRFARYIETGFTPPNYKFPI